VRAMLVEWPRDGESVRRAVRIGFPVKARELQQVQRVTGKSYAWRRKGQGAD
jgi:hypothetical protein